MKNIKQYSILIPVMLFIIIVSAGFIKNNDSTVDTEVTNTFNGKSDFKGVSEFFYRENNDSRIWHVVNLYSKDDSAEYNNSYYSFSKDTVTVVNHFKVTGEENFRKITQQ